MNITEFLKENNIGILRSFNTASVWVTDDKGNKKFELRGDELVGKDNEAIINLIKSKL